MKITLKEIWTDIRLIIIYKLCDWILDLTPPDTDEGKIFIVGMSVIADKLKELHG